MNDPHRPPRSGDRDAVMDRIRQAADEGRIGPADRDIRLGNVRSAQSMAELDLITRDLDLLESTFAPGSAPTAPMPAAQPTAEPSSPPPPPSASVETPAWSAQADAVLDAGKNAARRVAIMFVVVLTIGIIGATVFAAGLFGSTGSSVDSATVLPEPVPIGEEPITEDPEVDPGEDPGADPGAEEPDGPAYRLDGPGIRAFLAAYRAKFDTTRVVDLTMYDDYVIVRVPIAGKKRNQGWLYRPGDGWSDFGGIQANFPGSDVVDTARLNVPKLLGNIARARRTLGVEEYNLTYVNIDYRPGSDDAPNVNIYVSNEFHESGYLATTLDGSVERAYPFAN